MSQAYISQVEYKRTFNLGDFNSESIGVVIVEPDISDPMPEQQMMDKAKDFVIHNSKPYIEAMKKKEAAEAEAKKLMSKK